MKLAGKFYRLCLMLPGLLWLAHLRGEDRVTFAPTPESPPITIIGTIRDYTGKQLVIQPANKVPQTLQAEQILSIETAYGPIFGEAVDLLNRGAVNAAEARFREALQQESRAWVQRELLAWIIRCRHRQGDLLAAAFDFLELTRSDPESQHWQLAPLCWYATSLTPGQTTQAKSWLAGEDPIARLIAASWLLTDVTFGKPAQSALDELARNTNSVIAQLARCQLWRTRFGPLLTERTLAAWEGDLERMPRFIQAGPRYLVGQGHLQRQDYRVAAACLLWIPTVTPELEPLSARATFEAAEALRRSGLTREALNLYREVLARYNWTLEAAEARERLTAAAGT